MAYFVADKLRRAMNSYNPVLYARIPMTSFRSPRNNCSLQELKTSVLSKFIYLISNRLKQRTKSYVLNDFKQASLELVLSLCFDIRICLKRGKTTYF